MKSGEVQAALSIAEEGIKIIDREKAFVRAENNKLFRISLKIITHRVFNFLVSLCIMVNTGVLALDKYPIDPGQETIIEYINLAFYVVFLTEMILKLLGLGFKLYLKQPENIFDMIIVVLSTADVFIFFYTKIEEEEEGEIDLRVL